MSDVRVRVYEGQGVLHVVADLGPGFVAMPLDEQRRIIERKLEEALVQAQAQVDAGIPVAA